MRFIKEFYKLHSYFKKRTGREIDLELGEDSHEDGRYGEFAVNRRTIILYDYLNYELVRLSDTLTHEWGHVLDDRIYEKSSYPKNEHDVIFEICSSQAVSIFEEYQDMHRVFWWVSRF